MVHLGQRVGVPLLLGQLDQDAHVVEPFTQPGQALQLGVDGGKPGGDTLRVLLVVPQVGSGDGLLELGCLGALGFGVDNGLDLGQCLIEV